jgi:hypothetical protein
MRETAGSYRGALHIIAGVMTISAVLPILVRPPRNRDTAQRLLKERAGIPLGSDVLKSPTYETTATQTRTL